MINVADLKDPHDKQGRTYREINNQTKHTFNLLELVEIENGVRMFVAEQTRDCDGTPLYNLSPVSDSIHTNLWWRGLSEDGMRAVPRPRQ